MLSMENNVNTKIKLIFNEVVVLSDRTLAFGGGGGGGGKGGGGGPAGGERTGGGGVYGMWEKS